MRITSNTTNGLAERLSLNSIAAPVVHATTGAGTLASFGIEAPRVAFEVLAIGAFDLMERKELVPVGAASELASTDTAYAAGKNVPVVLTVGDVLCYCEDCVVAFLAATQERFAISPVAIGV
jgi:hypothetical protein